MAANVSPHWDKVLALIEQARTDESIRQILQSGTAQEKLQVLSDAGIASDDMAKAADDLALIANRESIHFWSW